MTISRSWCIAAAAVVGLGLSAETALAEGDAVAEKTPCFLVTQWNGWKAPSGDVLYLKVGMHDVYKVELSGDTPMLKWPNVHLVSNVTGSANICSAIDLDLKVSDEHGIPVGLIAKSLTKLTPEEVAAIPPKFRP